MSSEVRSRVFCSATAVEGISIQSMWMPVMDSYSSQIHHSFMGGFTSPAALQAMVKVVAPPDSATSEVSPASEEVSSVEAVSEVELLSVPLAVLLVSLLPLQPANTESASAAAIREASSLFFICEKLLSIF